MDKNNFNSCLSYCERVDIEVCYGEHGSLSIDQTPAASANINPRTGFPYSDMQKIMMQTDISERRRLLDNMQSYKDDFLPDNVSAEDAVKYMNGSNMQLPSEFTEEVERFTSQWVENKKKELKDKETMAFFDSVLPSKTD